MKNILAGEKRYEKGYIKVSHEYLDKEAEKRRLEYISNKKGDQFGCMWTLSSDYCGISSKNLLIEKNIKKHLMKKLNNNS